MNSTKTTLLLSVLTIALCLVLVTGATFALYTSEEPTNVVVSSGKVAVMAKFDKFSPYRDIDPKYGDPSKWLSGQQIQEVAPGEYQLINMAPYEGFTFEVVVENRGTVSIKWQMQIEIDCDQELLDHFTVQFEGDGLKNNGDSTFSSDTWYDLGVAEGENVSSSYTANVKLDGFAPIDAHSRRFSIKVTVFAIQANAVTE